MLTIGLTALGISGSALGADSVVKSTRRPVQVNVLDYGAKADGSDDCGPAFTAAAESLPMMTPGWRYGGLGGKIVVPPGTYKFDTSFVMPKSWGQYATVEIEMYGATLTTTNPIPIFDRWPASFDEAQFLVDAHLHFSGGTFSGSGLPNQTGIRLAASYNSTLENVCFKSLGWAGLDAYFCLGMNVRKCLFSYSAARIQSGTNFSTLRGFPGGTIGNSQCNHSTFKGCRFYAQQDMPYALGIFSASGVVVEDCIFEGLHPKADLLFDAEGMAIGGIRIVNTHLENSPSDAVFRFEQLNRATVTIDTISTAPGLIVNATNCDTPIFNIINYQYLDSTNLFDASTRRSWNGRLNQDGHEGWCWNFVSCTGLQGSDLRNPKWWKRGVVPHCLTITGAGTESKWGSQVGSLTASDNVTATNGYFLPTSAITSWPHAPRSPGEAYVGNSNGVIYILTSRPDTKVWAATNQIAP